MDEWKRPHQSVTDWDSTDEGWGSPMLGAVHWAVNYGPVSQCGSVPCLAKAWPALLEFFTSKPPSYCDEHQTNPKVEDTGSLNDLSQLAQRVFSFSSSLALPFPLFLVSHSPPFFLSDAQSQTQLYTSLVVTGWACGTMNMSVGVKWLFVQWV